MKHIRATKNRGQEQGEPRQPTQAPCLPEKPVCRTLAYREADALAREIALRFLAVRVLPDGSVAGLLDLLYTRAIVLGCSTTGYDRRFCFEDRHLAARRFTELRSEDDQPEGAVAQRGSGTKSTGDRLRSREST